MDDDENTLPPSATVLPFRGSWKTREQIQRDQGISERTFYRKRKSGEFDECEIDGKLHFRCPLPPLPNSGREEQSPSESGDEALPLWQSAMAVPQNGREMAEQNAQLRAELARAQGQLEAQRSEIAHLRALNEAYVRQNQASFLSDLLGWIKRLFK